MEASELIAGFGERIGIELVFGADGGCAFDADGFVVTANYLPETNTVVLSGYIGEPPPERLEGLYKAVLAANHLFSGTGGATMSLDQDTGRIALCRALPLALMDVDSFYAEVERFVNTAEVWRKIVSDYREAAGEASGLEEESVQFSKRGFMQV